MPLDDRPLCPTCHGTLKRITVGGEVPCTNCDGGYMRGIDDPTPEELRIDQLTRELTTVREDAARQIAALERQRDEWREAFNAELAGAGVLRAKCGARDDETFPDFVQRLHTERDASNRALFQVQEAAKDLTARLDDAVAWIGTVRDALVLAGYPGGDRSVALGNIRTCIQQRDDAETRAHAAAARVAQLERALNPDAMAAFVAWRHDLALAEAKAGEAVEQRDHMSRRLYAFHDAVSAVLATIRGRDKTDAIRELEALCSPAKFASILSASSGATCPLCGRIADPGPNEEVKTLSCRKVIGGCGRPLPMGNVRRACEDRLKALATTGGTPGSTP